MADDAAWESLLEVLPSLGQCRVFLQRIDPRLQKGESVPLDQQGWSVAVSLAESVLNVALTAPADSGLESTVAAIPIDGEVQIASNSLRCYSDHLCLSMCVSSVSTWLEKLLNQRSDHPDDEISDVRCRNCRELLLESEGKSAMVLPTTMWQACSELLACEECAPLGAAHVQAAKGRIYISPASLLVCSSDLLPGATLRNQEGLLQCANCSFTVGETQGKARVARRRPAARPVMNICRQGWRASAACANAPVSLYKHRVSMPRSRSYSVISTSNNISEAIEIEDAMEAYSEAAAVGMQLLSLRAQAGHSRFMLVPRSPGAEDVQLDDVAVDAEALEIRIVAAEVVLVGPHRHVPQSDARLPRSGRACKVCYRRCSCTSSSSAVCLVVVPHPEFQAVCCALDAWTATLPASLQVGPPFGRPDGIPWRTSYLPLPPRDSGLE